MSIDYCAPFSPSVHAQKYVVIHICPNYFNGALYNPYEQIGIYVVKETLCKPMKHS